MAMTRIHKDSCLITPYSDVTPIFWNPLSPLPSLYFSPPAFSLPLSPFLPSHPLSLLSPSLSLSPFLPSHPLPLSFPFSNPTLTLSPPLSPFLPSHPLPLSLPLFLSLSPPSLFISLSPSLSLPLMFWIMTDYDLVLERHQLPTYASDTKTIEVANNN